MNLPWNYLTLADLCEDIVAGRVFSLSRYGDGEFYWITGVPGFVSRSGHRTIPEGSEELRQTLLAQPTQHHAPLYYAGPLFFRNWGVVGVDAEKRQAKWASIEAWIRDNKLDGMTWVSNLLFVKGAIRAAQTRQVYPLLDAVRRVRTVVVGPHWLGRLESAGAFKPHAFIRVPEHDCYLAKADIKRAIVGEWERNRAAGAGPLFFSLSCSYLANILVHELYDTVGRDSWLVDVGSVWDNYCGVIQRGFHIDIAKKWGGLVL